LALSRYQQLASLLVRVVAQRVGKPGCITGDQDGILAGTYIYAIVTDRLRNRGRTNLRVAGAQALQHVRHTAVKDRLQCVARRPHALMFTGGSAGFGTDVNGRAAAVMQWQVQNELATLAGITPQANLAAEQARQLAADRQPEARTAVLAAGGPVRLLERLEDDPLLVRRDTDTRITDGKRHHLLGVRKRR